MKTLYAQNKLYFKSLTVYPNKFSLMLKPREFGLLDNLVPERAMMPPPLSGRGGGRGGGRGMKAKNAANAGISSGRGRGRGRGRGSSNVPGGTPSTSKGNTNILQISTQHVGLFHEDKPGMIK